MNDTPTQIEGYIAASIIVNEMLASAKKDKPKTSRHVKARSASYREGYYKGLLIAHCFQTLGEFPAANAVPIREALKRKLK